MFKEHPKGLRVLFFTEMWERFSYYGMRAILLLFMTTDAAREGLGLATDTAGAIYGLYTAGVYLLTLPGGWIADNILGQRKAIWYGGICIMTGHVSAGGPGSGGSILCRPLFCRRGNRSVKAEHKFHRRGFISGGRGQTGCRVLHILHGNKCGGDTGTNRRCLLWRKGELASGIQPGSLRNADRIDSIQIFTEQPGEIGLQPKVNKEIKADEPSNQPAAIALVVILIALLVLLQIFGYIDMLSAVGIAQHGRCPYRNRNSVLFCLCVCRGRFERYREKTDSRHLFSFYRRRPVLGRIRTGGFFTQPVREGLYGPVSTGLGAADRLAAEHQPDFYRHFRTDRRCAMGVKLAARNINPRTPFKFAIGLFLLAMGFLVMFFAARIVATGTKVGMTWLILTYFLHTIGELTLSPVGLSATTKAGPA